MLRRTKLMVAGALGLAMLGGIGQAPAIAQGAENASELRATGFVGEQWDGYLGVVGSPPPRIRTQMDAINIRRRARYTDLARRRGARIEEVAATAACEIFASRVLPGQYYRLQDGVWRQRNGNEPVPRPSYCG